MKIERRKFTRYQVPNDSVYVFSNYSEVKGWVKDISKGGMAFEYTPTESCEPKSEIRLILAGDTFPLYLPDIPCNTIYDIKMNKDDWPFRGPGTRRCGVQYEKLTTEMKEKLVLLLSSEAIMRNSEG